MDPEELLLTVAETSGHAWHVHGRGELDVASADQLSDRIEELVGRGATLVVLDLTDVSFVDSNGLRAIVGSGRLLEKHDGRLIIEGMSPAAQRLLEVTGLIESYRR
jgi:anti-sigma B factor antagonist